MITAGQTTASLPITSIDDSVLEDQEPIVVDVESVIGAGEIGRSWVVVTLVDDEIPSS